jgi:TonB family protein
MSALVQRGMAQGRPMALTITIALHVALVAGLLAIKVVESARQGATPIQFHEIRDERPAMPEVQPIEPVLGKPTAVPRLIPNLPDFPIEDSISAQVMDASRQVIPIDVPQYVDTTTVMVADTPLRYQAVRPSDDYYPPQAIRMAAEGAAVVRTCVDSAGRLSGAPTVVRTSRVSLLDAAAVKWASEALRFQPATRGGAAVASCKEFRVSFTLH